MGDGLWMIVPPTVKGTIRFFVDKTTRQSQLGVSDEFVDNALIIVRR
jgi:hypothetical protein